MERDVYGAAAQLEKLGGEPFVRADVALTYVEGTIVSSPQSRATRGWRSANLAARYYYSLGMHLALVLDRADPTWKSRVSEEPEWSIDLAHATAASALPARKDPAQ